MLAPAILHHARARLRRPGTWGAGLLLGCVWTLLRWGTGPGGWLTDGVWIPFLLGVALAVVAALPWQWTGDARPLAPFARGLAQALALDSALAAVAIALLWAPAALPPMGPPMGRGRMMGRGMMMGHGMIMGQPFGLPPWQGRLLILGLVTVGVAVLLGRLLALQEGERLRADQAERYGREAQTRALQAQMNPHVLFNAISGLAEFAHTESPATEAALVQLAELLRGLLDHSGRTSAPLAQERDLVERLLHLEQFRLGDRLRVTWVWDAALERLLAPPLLLQPLVENAIRHGIGPNRAGGELEIGLAGTPEALRLWVANTGLPYQPGSKDGTGLGNLRQRLALMPGRQGQLTLGAAGGRTLAELRLGATEAGHG